MSDGSLGRVVTWTGRRLAAAGRHIHPFEIAAWAFLTTAVIFLRWRGLGMDWVTVEYTVPPLLPVTLKALLAGLPLYAVYYLVVHRSLVGYLRRVASPGWLLLWLRLWIVCVVFTYTYIWLKVSVPLVNLNLWDAQLWRLDTLLHFGFSPSVFLTSLLHGTVFVGWLDVWYSWWLPSVMYGIAFFAAHEDALVRRRTMLSWVLIWCLGAWLYTALPALGPVYSVPEVWTDQQTAMPGAEGAQRGLMENYQKVLQGRTGPLKQFNPTRGIAALPSLHVGVHWLLTLWLWRYLRPLLVLGLLATALTFVGSIVTGWHYAVDGYAGIALAQGCYWLSLKLEPSPEP